ncbi:MAG: flagellar hook-length control protein FliK [Candidatus Melainabacteria bacterium]
MISPTSIMTQLGLTPGNTPETGAAAPEGSNPFGALLASALGGLMGGLDGGRLQTLLGDATPQDGAGNGDDPTVLQNEANTTTPADETAMALIQPTLISISLPVLPLPAADDGAEKPEANGVAEASGIPPGPASTETDQPAPGYAMSHPPHYPGPAPQPDGATNPNQAHNQTETANKTDNPMAPPMETTVDDSASTGTVDTEPTQVRHPMGKTGQEAVSGAGEHHRDEKLINDPETQPASASPDTADNTAAIPATDTTQAVADTTTSVSAQTVHHAGTDNTSRPTALSHGVVERTRQAARSYDRFADKPLPRGLQHLQLAGGHQPALSKAMPLRGEAALNPAPVTPDRTMLEAMNPCATPIATPADLPTETSMGPAVDAAMSKPTDEPTALDTVTTLMTPDTTAGTAAEAAVQSISTDVALSVTPTQKSDVAKDNTLIEQFQKTLDPSETVQVEAATDHATGGLPQPKAQKGLNAAARNADRSELSADPLENKPTDVGVTNAPNTHETATLHAHTAAHQAGAHSGITDVTRGAAMPEGAQPEMNPVAEQVLDGTLSAMKSGQKEVTLKLNPLELGEVRVNMVSDANQVLNARFVATTPEAAEALHQRIHQLKETLENQGVQVGRLTVVMAGQPESATNLGQDRSSQSSQQHRQDPNQQHLASQAQTGQFSNQQQANQSAFWQQLADNPGIHRRTENDRNTTGSPAGTAPTTATESDRHINADGRISLLV